MKTNDIISQQLEEFDKLEVTYSEGYIEPLMLDEESEKVVKSFLRSSFLALLESIGEEVEGMEKRFKCGKCDGAKNLEHTHCCVALSTLRTRLTEIIKTVKKEKYE